MWMTRCLYPRIRPKRPAATTIPRAVADRFDRARLMMKLLVEERNACRTKRKQQQMSMRSGAQGSAPGYHEG